LKQICGGNENEKRRGRSGFPSRMTNKRAKTNKKDKDRQRGKGRQKGKGNPMVVGGEPWGLG
jgi:hypothetical protein